MSIDDNKKIISHLLEEGLAQGKQAVAEKLLARDFVDHNPLPGLTPDREGFKQSFAVFRSAFPDFTYTIKDMVAEGDRVVVRFTANGTHRGEMAGIPPTGKQISVTGMDLFRLAGGKVAEFWLSWDQLGLMQQLGGIHLPEKPVK
jgi:steroid delta-isomerase-like uncharacterized protein